MDSKSLSEKKSEEAARETLIAISSASPEKTLDLYIASESTKADEIAVSNNDGNDKFRSKLISISYAGSPDNKV